MIPIINLGLTSLLALYVIFWQKRYGTARMWVVGTGFFVVSFYVDNIFWLIMGSAAEIGQKLLFQGLGIVVSKGILAVVLLVAWIMGHEPEERDSFRRYWADEENGSNKGDIVTESGKGDIEAGRVKRDLELGMGIGEIDTGSGKRVMAGVQSVGWQYLDGLTLGINLFFLMLGMGTMFVIRGLLYTHDSTVLNFSDAWNYIFATESISDLNSLEYLQHSSFAAVLLLTLFLAILLAYYGSLCAYRKKQEQKSAQSEVESRKHEADIYLESIEEHYQRTRELWHDLKNHISLLSLLLADRKYEQMADYLRIFGNDVDAITLPMKSGNLIVDALLTDKLAKARKENIEVTLSLCDLTDLRLRSDEICGLFGNLLDNALEANLQVEEGRFLTVDCRNREDFYYIKITNAVSKAKSQNGILQTAKSDRKNQVGHGLGLRCVERIVHGCGGELAVDSSGNRFTAVVRLPK